MNIVFLRSNPVDPDPRVEKEVDSLLGAGHNIIILAWDRRYDDVATENYKTFGNGRALIVRFHIKAEFGGGLKNISALLKFQKCLYKWLRNNKDRYDVIHACDFDTGLVGCFIKKKKMVYDVFDYYADCHSLSFARRFVRSLENNIINTANATIICTEERLKQIEGSNPQKLYVIHNTPPIKIIEGKFGLNQSKIKIVYVGILPTQGRFIKELVEICERNLDFELHIGGFGNLEEYLIEKAETCSNIFFYGKMSYDNTIELESEADIMTAIYDPDIVNHRFAAPNKFYEALMLGKPLIMIRGTGMSDIVEQNRIGCVVDYSKESLERGIGTLVNNKFLWSEMSKKMKVLYQEQYSWGIMEERLVELYKDI